MRIDDYLARIGLPKPLPPSIATLRALHAAHLATFTFDNIDVRRGVAIRTDVASVEAKFLDRHAGGYCFEHNTLFGAVLRELGFEVTTLLARVCAGERDSWFLNHMLLRVVIDDEPWLADVGFGAEGFTQPLPLRDGHRETQQGLEYSLRRYAHRWLLSTRYGDVDEPSYEFTEDAHTTADVAMANWYTSASPDSIFTQTLTIQRVTPEERLIIRPKVVTRYRDGVRVDQESTPDQVGAHAKALFGIEL
jgi:N-hydroxyarylamine O-acetyltransferase